MSRRKFYVLAGLAALWIIGGGWALRAFLAGLPSFQSFEEYQPSLTTKVFDRHGDLIAELSIEKRALLTLAEIPVDLQNAVLGIEDSRFFQHWGVSPRGMLRAAAINFLARRVVQGGSTLTQQLAKLIFLSPERTITRKIKEMLLAMQLERNLSKEEILQFYLNQVYFGHGAYGVMAAASIYFNKEVKDLTLGECALLAGLVKYPGGYSPFRFPDRAKKRRSLVLQRMLEEKYITAEELKKANDETIPGERPTMAGMQAPYFVDFVRRKLEPKYGYNMLWRGGLKIHTSLELRLQKIAEEEMDKALTAFDEKAKVEWARQLKEEEDAGIEPPTISTNPPAKVQGTFVLMDVKSGGILAMIGGRSGGGPTDFNRAVQARRQPGSTFKPFVWAAALNAGMTGMTLVEDSPLAYYYDGRDWRLLEGATDQYAIDLATSVFAGSPDFKVWVPSNFDDKFLGVMTLRHALALSRNMASVRLIQQVGPPQVVEIAHRCGILSRLAPVLALGLGSSVVSALELGNAFSTFANGGIHVKPFSVARVEGPRGNILERHVPVEAEAVSPQLAYLTTHLMKAVVEGGTGSRARVLKRPLAGKTGTTNESRDLWFVGFTPDLLAIAWMGYDDDTTLGKKAVTGGTVVVPWWSDIMKKVLEDYPVRDFPVPEGIAFLKMDSQTGLLAVPTCPRQVLQAFIKGTEPTQFCPFDHSQPLALRADFSVSGDMRAAFMEQGSTNAVPGGEPPDLPSDDQLENPDEETAEPPEPDF
ncbi:MAG: hypothetical protein A2X36_08710 [Elusimicrobia bacterium GWA2_69_24]|nr:MAG: hypothetical protein A2X36_08710 [Elusimicrobia bacterium GWA2_69_24]HBL18176.1 penicillin-binding protein [Elusimicrobiota bacterium]